MGGRSARPLEPLPPPEPPAAREEPAYEFRAEQAPASPWPEPAPQAPASPWPEPAAPSRSEADVPTLALPRAAQPSQRPLALPPAPPQNPPPLKPSEPFALAPDPAPADFRPSPPPLALPRPAAPPSAPPLARPAPAPAPPEPSSAPAPLAPKPPGLAAPPPRRPLKIRPPAGPLFLDAPPPAPLEDLLSTAPLARSADFAPAAAPPQFLGAPPPLPGQEEFALAPEPPEAPTADFSLVPPDQLLWSVMPESALPTGQWPDLPETSPFDALPLAPPPELTAEDLLLGAPNLDADGTPVLEFAAELALGAPTEIEELDPFAPPPPSIPVERALAAPVGLAPVEAPLPELEEEDEPEPEEPTARQYTYRVGDSLEALASALSISKPPPAPEAPPPPPLEAPKRSKLKIQPRALDVALIPRKPPTLTQLLGRKLRRWLGHSTARVSSEELAVFTRQMAAMIGAGIPIHQVLTFYAESGEGDLAAVISDVANRVSSGVRFSHALRSHPDVFSEVYCALIETGETSSQILEILEKLAELLEKQVRMRKRIISVVTYPAILLVVSFGAILGFVYFVLPMLEPLFKDVPMPLPTLILLKARIAIPVGAVLVVLGTLGYWLFKPRWRLYLARSPETRYRLDNLPLRLPLMGKTIEKIVVARVLYSLATMLEAGITIIQALGRCASVAGNAVVARRVYGAIDALVGGSTVAEALGAHHVFPAGCIQLLCAGEEASSLSDTVRYAARFYEEEVELALTDAAAMLEPAIMLGMGVIVGFIVLSAVLPTLALLNNL